MLQLVQRLNLLSLPQEEIFEEENVCILVRVPEVRKFRQLEFSFPTTN